VRQRSAFLFAICSVLATVIAGCDPQQLVNDYFKSLGLNPLLVVRDDVKPGELIVQSGNNAVLADSIFSYAPAAPGPKASSENLDNETEFQAVLKAHETDRTVDANAAVTFLKTVLPVDISADLGLTSSVTINAINATGHRLPVPDVLRWLHNNSAPIHDLMQTQAAGATAYVAYEVYMADTINIVAQNGADVSTKVALDGATKALSSANAGFTYKRTAKDTLTIKGDHPYVFAIRTGKLVYKNGAYSMEVTNFASGAVKAVGGDEKYAAPVNPGFGLLALKKRK